MNVGVYYFQYAVYLNILLKFNTLSFKKEKKDTPTTLNQAAIFFLNRCQIVDNMRLISRMYIYLLFESNLLLNDNSTIGQSIVSIWRPEIALSYKQKI